jgi:hypothetical protein
VPQREERILMATKKKPSAARKLPIRKENRFYWSLKDSRTCMEVSWSADGYLVVVFDHQEIRFTVEDWLEMKEAVDDLVESAREAGVLK